MNNFLALHAPLILASASPRRKKLLEQLGFEFRVVVSEFDEEAIPTHITPTYKPSQNQKHSTLRTD
jgi:predicted house-cleaning NTP pyrophosphatase (Maf/HAM1 superfamily)